MTSGKDRPAAQRRFSAILLAGDRGCDDPVAAARGVSCKAIAPVAGVPMVLRVLAVLTDCPWIDRILLCGSAADDVRSCRPLQQILDTGSVEWIAGLNSPTHSVEAALGRLGDQLPVLVTTADHAMLSTKIIDEFCNGVTRKAVDAAVGLVHIEKVKALFPESRRTLIKLRDGPFCGCNLFAFMNARGRSIVQSWYRLEEHRKQPWKIAAGLMGYVGICKYLLGILGSAEAFARISGRLDARISCVQLSFGEAGVDVDSVADLMLAEAYLEKRANR